MTKKEKILSKKNPYPDFFIEVISYYSRYSTHA